MSTVANIKYNHLTDPEKKMTEKNTSGTAVEMEESNNNDNKKPQRQRNRGRQRKNRDKWNPPPKLDKSLLEKVKVHVRTKKALRKE